MDAEKIGKGIGYLRRRYGFTQRYLADLLCISDKAVSKWERGLSVPDVSRLSRLAIIFDTDIESLLEGNLANFRQEWQGELSLSYPPGIHADTLLYDKPLLCYQLSYFLLAGIAGVRLTGDSLALETARRLLGDGAALGLTLTYSEEGAPADAEDLMRVEGAPFLYGKDLTKTMRRILYGTMAQARLVDWRHRPLGVTFVRRAAGKPQDVLLERGTIAFPIRDADALLAAAGIAASLAAQMDEHIADLKEIATARNLIG